MARVLSYTHTSAMIRLLLIRGNDFIDVKRESNEESAQPDVTLLLPPLDIYHIGEEWRLRNTLFTMYTIDMWKDCL